MVEARFEKKIKIVHSDFGGKFLPKGLFELTKKRIMHQTSCMHTPQEIWSYKKEEYAYYRSNELSYH